jgi:hypothetical protein
MQDSERLLGKLEEHARSSEKRFDRLEHKVDTLLSFKYKILGASAVISVIIAIVFEFFR